MKSYEKICHYSENEMNNFKKREICKNATKMQNWPFINSDLFKLN